MTEHQLTLHSEKTRIVDARQAGGFDFLGYHFERGYKWPRLSLCEASKLREPFITSSETSSTVGW